MISKDRLIQMVQRFEFVEAQLSGNLSSEELKVLGQEYSELKPIVKEIISYNELLRLLDESKELLLDPEMKNLAVDEIQKIEKELNVQENLLMLSLVPKDKTDLR